jgi:DNA-directed RNA polymerase subunit RPC12/RpoP
MRVKTLEIPCPHCGDKVPILYVDPEPPPRLGLEKKNRKEKTETAYPCKECGRVFWSPQAVGKHRQAAHGVKGQKRRRKVK